jgi:hypothetical protein
MLFKKIIAPTFCKKVILTPSQPNNNTHAMEDNISVVSGELPNNEGSLFSSSESEHSDLEEDEPVVEDINLEIVGLLSSTNVGNCDRNYVRKTEK